MDSVDIRGVRAWVAWMLLLAAAVLVVVAAWQFIGPNPQSALSVSFAERGLAAVGSLAGIGVTLLPAAAVVLAVAGRPVEAARYVALTGVVIQAVALALAVLAWAAALTVPNPGWSPLTGAADLIVAAACLVLTVTVLRSLAPPAS